MSNKQSTTEKRDLNQVEQEPCPVHASLSEFMHEVAEGDIRGAARLLRSADPTWAEELWPVRIGHLVKYVADWQQSHSGEALSVKPWRQYRVAVVGAGTAGLVCAGSLARLGYPVVIYEGVETPGGVFRFATSDAESQKILDWEVEILQRLGVEIHCNSVVGEQIKLKDLSDKMGFGAIFLATGTGLAHSLGEGHSLDPLADETGGTVPKRTGAIIVEEHQCLEGDQPVSALDHALAGTASVIQSASAGRNGAARIHREISEEEWAETKLDEEWDDFVVWCREQEHIAHE